MRIILVLAISISLGAILLLVVSEMPEYGCPESPVRNEVAIRYIEKGVAETGSQNLVTAILTDYRAFDTLGEVVVLFVAIVATIAALGCYSLSRTCPVDEEGD